MLTKENIQRKNKPLRKIVKAIGCGGVSLIAMATGLSRTTITDTIKETSKLKRMELQNNSKTNIICSGYLWTITEIIGFPLIWNFLVCLFIYSNWAFRSGCELPSFALRLE